MSTRYYLPTKEDLFDCVGDCPATWLMKASQLKLASDKIDSFNDNHEPRHGDTGDLVFLVPVHRLLMGLSFENLLKGLIIAQGAPAGSDGKLHKSFDTHRVTSLLSRLDASFFPISPSERNALLNLEKYVIWMGRYPIPKKATSYDRFIYCASEHRIEQTLWDRMEQKLRRNGWIKKPDGSKAPIS